MVRCYERIKFHIEQATFYHKIKIPGKSHIKIPAAAKNDMTVFFFGVDL
jgi:hypothetical protein